MRRLPEWAANPEARAMLQEIIALPPESYVRSATTDTPAEERFSARTPSGRLVCKLRRFHHKWMERQLKALDTQFHVLGKWDHDAARALHETEDADALVKRLLREAERADLDPKDIGNGRFQVAA